MSTFNVPHRVGKVGTDAIGWTLVAQSNTLAFTDTTAKDLFDIPLPYRIVDFYVDVTTVFNSSGTDLVDLGVLGTANRFADNLNVASIARLLGSSDVSQLANYSDTSIGAPITVQGLYAQSVADSTTGAATVTVVYWTPITPTT